MNLIERKLKKTDDLLLRDGLYSSGIILRPVPN